MRSHHQIPSRPKQKQLRDTPEDKHSSRQDHVEEPHSLHEPKTHFWGGVPVSNKPKCRSAADLEPELPGPSKGQAKRQTCVDKEV
ncbi:hypothetical protein JB92DRAFT_2896501, partial [Gautieria morchelliformis]